MTAERLRIYKSKQLDGVMEASMDLKALFNGGALTYEQFEAAVKEAKLNIVNLAEGGYVS